MTEPKPNRPNPPYPYQGTRIRSVRMADELWDSLAEVAAAEGTNVSALIRRNAEREVRRFRRRQRRRGHGTPRH